MKPKALIVEDDEHVIDSVEDALFSIGHDYDWVTNQHDAQENLKSTDYQYVLLDLQIPAKPNRGGAEKEFGCNLLREIQKIKGHHRLPVIVMTGFSADCLDLSVELSANGACDFISKPFPSTGRTLASVIRKVLSTPRESSLPYAGSPAKSSVSVSAPRPFAGGELVIYSDRAELSGVKIISDRGAGQSLMLLRQLRQRDRHGRFERFSAESLADSIAALGGVGTVTGCVRAIRRNVVNRLSKHHGVNCQSDDLIRSDEQGYYLREWITVRDVTGAAGIETSASEVPSTKEPCPLDGSAMGMQAPSEPAHGGDGESLNERQVWILSQLRRGVALRRGDLERQFQVHARTAKRDLAELNQRGQIDFVGGGRDGNYVLRGSVRD